MLVISLKPGEQLRIGRDITVKILKSNSGMVRLGVEAPATLKVAREQEHHEISEKNKKTENKTWQKFNNTR